MIEKTTDTSLIKLSDYIKNPPILNFLSLDIIEAHHCLLDIHKRKKYIRFLMTNDLFMEIGMIDNKIIYEMVEINDLYNAEYSPFFRDDIHFPEMTEELFLNYIKDNDLIIKNKNDMGFQTDYRLQNNLNFIFDENGLLNSLGYSYSNEQK